MGETGEYTTEMRIADISQARDNFAEMAYAAQRERDARFPCPRALIEELIEAVESTDHWCGGDVQQGCRVCEALAKVKESSDG